MHMHVTKEPEPPSAHRPEIRPELDTLVLRMLGKVADKRPAMREVSAELTALERPDTQSMPVLTPPAMPIPWYRTSRQVRASRPRPTDE